MASVGAVQGVSGAQGLLNDPLAALTPSVSAQEALGIKRSTDRHFVQMTGMSQMIQAANDLIKRLLANF